MSTSRHWSTESNSVLRHYAVTVLDHAGATLASNEANLAEALWPESANEFMSAAQFIWGTRLGGLRIRVTGEGGELLEEYIATLVI